MKMMTHQKLVDYFEDERNLFMVWDESTCFCPTAAYGTVEYMSLFISTSGTIDVETDQSFKHAGVNHFQFFLPGTNMRICSVSEDYHSMGLVFSDKFKDAFYVQNHPYISLARMYCCLEINERHRKEMLEFISFLDHVKKAGKTDDNMVVQHLLAGVFTLIGKMYENWVNDYVSGAKSKLVTRFSELVTANYRSHRDVAFYANQLNVSMSYFSQIIKRATGMSPYRCVEKYVILNACRDLVETSKCVKEIAMSFNFDDSSHFCKYFKKNTGQTPEEYRQRRQSQMDSEFVL